uniref:THO complex 3 n=1 Tax=Pipistrellus kuhlii TaxID=59472 RepID=A0A7J7XCV3_PIPKU|nr:THO complex 3 [Pipistrellus kuhlii]
MAVPAAAMGPSALGPGGAGSLAPWSSVGGGPTRYVLGMQELFRGHSKTREFPAHSAKVHSVAWSCDGRRLASGSFDKTASVFLLEKDRLGRTLTSVGVQMGRPSPWATRTMW